MCGGVGFRIERISENELRQFYSPDELKEIKNNGQATSFFWSAKPVLPVQEKNEVRLYNWGNRDKEIKLPTTGWAKQESLKQGKWNHLEPKIVNIVAEQGYEKGVWFKIKKGLKGVLVKNRVYMLTQPADHDYQELTKHDRMPIVIDQPSHSSNIVEGK
ncbi:MAG: hypothetical protein ABH884_03270 [Candidatus Komeilibacteria bacterium]